ncbi:nucleoporin SEH1-like isoform X1 [Lytechinus pictus]|uniref:nucleoporin SEH1-like isoform X1 n=1 Tax=Lytechinus pictus TaxID=7653 RepID=UPI0030B9B1E8
MFKAKSISAEHKDLIHDVAFDFYGQRMATCSSDQSVQVWDLGEDGEWHCTASWKTHSGSVWRVTWAHPEFGQVLASCSFDRTAVVWEEMVGDSKPNERGKHHWAQRAMLVDSRTSVSDVKFAPHHLGLQLATCSADGIVRIYEAPEVTNLATMNLQTELQTKLSCSCLSWNPSRVHPPMIAVGSDSSDPSGGGKVQIYEYKENERKWQKIDTLNVITEAVHDLAFSPNLGRSYHMLAVATKDVRIMTLKPMRRDQFVGSTRIEIRQAAQLVDFKQSQVWRVSWNVTGTILAASSDDGYVRLFKANYLDNWKCIQELKGSDGGPSPALMTGVHSRQDYPSHRGRNTSSGTNQQQNGAGATREPNAPLGGRSSEDYGLNASRGQDPTPINNPATNQPSTSPLSRSLQESFLALPFRRFKEQSSALFSADRHLDRQTSNVLF